MRNAVPAWVRSAVLALDHWLCRRQHFYEFTDDPQCLFRIQCLRSGDALELADGTRVRPGARVLALHLWNEHVPLMGDHGPSLAWGRRIDRAIRVSLRALANHLAEHPGLSDIVAIRGDMRLGGARQAAQFARITARYGFEIIDRQGERRGVLRRAGETILVAMLVLGTNSSGLRSAPLRLTSARLWLSRAMLENYGPARQSPGISGSRAATRGRRAIPNPRMKARRADGSVSRRASAQVDAARE